MGATNSRVQLFTSDGRYLGGFGGRGSEPGQFHTPHGLALDSRGYLYVVDTQNSRIQKFDPSRAGARAGEVDAEYTNRGLAAGFNGTLPFFKPPYAHLVAIDLNEGTIAWRQPFGDLPDLRKEIEALGVKAPEKLGAQGPPGAIVTRGGLIFIGTFSDRMLRAYDKDTGKVLWEKELQAGPEGIPAVYEAGGRQFIAFSTRAGRVFDNIGADSIAWAPGKPEAAGY